ncbi:hypothetical protein SAMN05216371_0360 [Streptomyces sp. TLI_053]|uniref:hypothetical protein n=1 Tax=Streptomyces sp. TLI_053 TaxID=1855352 RepID=UPI00087D1E0B|nr:hypothetical protein [Streptomyces sp. TLI_053]SDS65893.1 hypothetical protein SAMN05216371_0360 [Streptomyces sp. TLI_053]
MVGEIGAQGYVARLEDEKVVFRNERGRVLKKVPPALAGHPGLPRLVALAAGAEAHRRVCGQEAERLVRDGVAVPAGVVELLSVDAAWTDALALAGITPTGNARVGTARAGAVPSAGEPDDEGALLARRYRHQALPDAERVLLTTPDAARHRDRLMAHQGWQAVGPLAPTGLPADGAVPFPEAALAGHPAREQEVLRYVERLEEVTSVWRVWVKRDVDAVLKAIAATDPVLSRCFLDGVADLCLRHGGERADAAAWFARARTAERAAGEHVDQEWLDARYAAADAAGALTDTALRERVRQVTARGADRDAARRTLTLLGDRTVREGTRPGLVDDLVRTARAAGLDPSRELARLAGRRLPARDLWHTAAREFWSALLTGPAWELVLAERPHLGREVVAAGPQSGMPEADLTLDYLERTGALAHLTTDAEAGGAAPGTAADWLRALVVLADRSLRSRVGPVVHRLAALLAPRIAADGVPVDLPYPSRWDRRVPGSPVLRLGVLDVLLAAGAPVADPPPRLADPRLHRVDAAPRPGLPALSADPRFARELRALLRAEFELTNGGDADNLWYQPHDPKGWTETPALVDTEPGRAELAQWCEEELTELPVLDLDGVALTLARFQHIGAAAALLADPERARRLAAVDVPALLLDAVRAETPDTGLDRAGAELLLGAVEARSVFRDAAAGPVRQRIGRLLGIDDDLVGREFTRLVQIAANCRDGLAHLVPLLTPAAAAASVPPVPAPTAPALPAPAAPPALAAPPAAPPSPPAAPARVRVGRLLREAATSSPLWDGDLDRPSAIVPGASAAFPYLVVDWQAELLRGDTTTPGRLREYADLAFVAERGEGRWRTVTLSRPDHRPTPPAGHLFRTALSTALVLHSTFNRAVLLEYAPGGTFPENGPAAAAGCEVRADADLTAELDPDLLHAYLEGFAERGPLPAHPGTVEHLAERLALTLAEAGALLAVRTHHRDYESAAEKALTRRIGADAVREFRTRLVPAEPERLWTHGPDVDRAVAWWHERYGAPPADADLIALARREIRFPTGEWTPAGPGPAADPVPPGLRRRCRHPEALLAAALATKGDPDHAPAPYASPYAMAWLAYRTPAGHPLRPALAAAALRVSSEREDPRAVWRVFSVDRRSAAGRPPTPPADLPGVEVVDEPAASRWHVLVRPGLLTGADDPVLDALDDYYDRLKPSQARPSGSGLPALADLRILLSGDLAALGHHLAADADRAPGWEQDPRRSAPDVVAACADALDLTSDAAALYLMLLALPDPTDRQVRQWTGWTPAVLTAAGQGLSATGRVVTARRSRAGRTLVLPGPWLDLKAPRLPVEAAKLAHLTLAPERASTAHTVLVPTRPLPTLFTTAWHTTYP